MAQVNRAMAPGWNIWADQTDSLAQRDTGWVQFYCENGQEVLDTTIQAFRLAEWVNLPVMVNLDAFFLSHTYEPVDIPEQKFVDRFLPPYKPRFQLDLENPCAFNQLAPPNIYMEMRHSIQMAMEEAFTFFEQMEEEFESILGRRHGAVEAIQCDDAEIILITTGTVTSTSRQVVAELRDKGEKVGLLKIKLFRPFPVNMLREIIKPASKVAVIDRNFSFGASGIFAQEVKAALCNFSGHPPVYGYVAGLGGRDITTEVIEEIYWLTKKSTAPENESSWVGLREVDHAVGQS
jgi:pyruvate/2-oxoacid:ferredoxin oxidoreductase alpha subunit